MSHITAAEGSDGRPVMGQSVVPGSPSNKPSQNAAALIVDSANFQKQIDDTGCIVYRDQKKIPEEGVFLMQVNHE